MILAAGADSGLLPVEIVPQSNANTSQSGEEILCKTSVQEVSNTNECKA